MVMRVGGLATGMDIEGIVNKLMDAERIPLVKLQQDKTMFEWKRDAFRDVNRTVSELDSMMLDMKLSKTYDSKTVTSSQSNAVTATGSSSTPNGNYSIAVTQLARNEMHIGAGGIDVNEKFDADTAFEFKTYGENGEAREHKITAKSGETVKDVLKKINDVDGVRAFFDPNQDRVVLETTRTGKYNPELGGVEIEFTAGAGYLGLGEAEGAKIVKAQNAKFNYNDGLELESKNNSYSLNGINYQFHGLTEPNKAANLTVSTNVDASFDGIVKFVDKYNEVIDKINESQREEKFRDFKPLTDEQRKAMSDDEVEKWEEKAKSGILRGESALSNSMYAMRGSWYSSVETGGEFSSLTEIGIKTTSNYMDGGKLVIDEDRLKEVLRENPEDVQKLFSNSAEGSSRGLINRLEDSVKQTMGSIERQAGKGTHTLDNYTLGKRMKEVNDRIAVFEARMIKVEQRHWNQFTQMEKAIQRLNDQSSQLFSQFG